MISSKLYETLTNAHQRQRLNIICRYLLLYLAILIIAIPVVFVADNIFNLTPTTRLSIGIIFIFANFATLLTGYLKLWRKPFNLKRTAIMLEQKYDIQDNCLINAIYFDATLQLDAGTRQAFLDIANKRCFVIDLKKLWQRKELKHATFIMLGALLIFIAYTLPFANFAQNAMHRFLNPNTDLTPLNCTNFRVKPGNIEVIEGDNCLITATATKFNRKLAALQILLKSADGKILYPMKENNQGLCFQLNSLKHNLKYRLKNGNDLSNWYAIDVIEKPRFKDLNIQITPPKYTGANSYKLDNKRRTAEILRSSQIAITPKVDKNHNFLLFYENKTENRDKFIINKKCQITIDIEDDNGLKNSAAWACEFQPIADKIPEVRFLASSLNREVMLNQSLPIQLDLQDDYGVTALQLYTIDNNHKEVVLKTINFSSSKKQRRDLTMLTIDPKIFAINASYQIWARVKDNMPNAQIGKSFKPLTIHITDPTEDMANADPKDPYIKFFNLLLQTLNQQKKTQTRTASFANRLTAYSHFRQLINSQNQVHSLLGGAVTMAQKSSADGKLSRNLYSQVGAIYHNISKVILKHTNALSKVEAGDKREIAVNELVLEQNQLIQELQKLLGITTAKKVAEDAKQKLEDEEQGDELTAKLKELQDKLADFKDQQKDIIKKTEAIDKKDPEDWTMEDEELLGDLAAKEADLSRFFKAAFNDLSKMENQDFSNSMMAEELIEMYEELQKAGEALEKEKTEIATIAEQMGVELAESIETNLERWLSDEKDSKKWVAEESGESPDVPLQDLPDELTDIIGDLIDDVADMEDVEDSSNSYLSAIDEGAGWGVSDGNIDSMAAKGITGNIMPNDNEVGGRSGEGRSGKSSGQFVEEEATGKGGRETPTRLTQSPYEEGTVKDSSKDPQGGATGGGKQSGIGDIGLRGITPDRKTDLDQRLPGNQAELKQKAEALVRRLSAYHLPTTDLESAIQKMGQVSRQNVSGKGMDFRHIKSDLLTTLKDAQASLTMAKNGGIDISTNTKTSKLKSKFQASDKIPSGYEGVVNGYFRSLAKKRK